MAQNSFFPLFSSIRCSGHLLEFTRPVVMGILNLTPDSFYDGGKFTDTQKMLHQAGKMIREGASIIDLGAQSTRPGARLISEKAERQRLIPALIRLKKKFPDQLFSADTFYASVAQAAVEHGAHLINDISGGTLDRKMFSTVARLKVPYILVHIKSRPATMHRNPVYKDVLSEVIDFFQKRIYRLRDKGVNDIIVDPGFGFGKTVVHNFILLKHLPEIKMLTGCRILAGLSRKSMIHKTLNQLPSQSLNGTTVLNTVALLNQADILRVHDVKEAMQCVALTDFIRT